MEINIHGFIVTIDRDDYSRVSKYRWQVNSRNSRRIYFHVYSRDICGKRIKIYMHRYIMEANKGDIVDHIDGETLNCKKKNMRITDRTGNARNKAKGKNNTSGYKGVSWAEHAGRWRARIMNEGKYEHIGYFDTIEAAFSAYCDASKKYHGEYGRTV